MLDDSVYLVETLPACEHYSAASGSCVRCRSSGEQCLCGMPIIGNKGMICRPVPRDGRNAPSHDAATIFHLGIQRLPLVPSSSSSPPTLQQFDCPSFLNTLHASFLRG
ncbi:hypothetical protein AcW1_000912 [Taiwanofungus camphoratus]|nr:hypothetical protein AcW1_000912 [Antrodia cinnamomea]